MEKGFEYVKFEQFEFQDGTVLPEVRVAYRQVNAGSPKVALIPTCFGARVADTDDYSDAALAGYRVIIIAIFGNGESSSPSNTRGFPKSLDYRDCVRSQYRLLTEHFGLESLDVVIGFSMGGQQAYYWSVMYPDFVKNAVSICSSAKTSRHNRQFLEGPRAALEYSIDYTNKDPIPVKGTVTQGMKAFALAWSAWLTSAQWFEKECYKQLGFDTQAAWSENQTKCNEGWTPDDLLILLRMWQNGDISKCIESSEGSLEAALATIQARVLVMPCRTDQYFCSQASEIEVKHLKKGVLRVIPSIWGHIAGANPVDVKWINEEISRFLQAA